MRYYNTRVKTDRGSIYTVSAMPRPMKTALPPLTQITGNVGQRIMQVRKERGLTQKELAERIGIKRTLVTDYETGRLHLGDEMVTRFALALGVSSDLLLGLSEDVLDHQPDLKITRRLRRIHQLPPAQQKLILRSLDLMIDSAQRSND